MWFFTTSIDQKYLYIKIYAFYYCVKLSKKCFFKENSTKNSLRKQRKAFTWLNIVVSVVSSPDFSGKKETFSTDTIWWHL